jgi:hypothetical protein
MSPQLVPILAFEAINLAKTMRASFKTAEVAGYFGWGWVTIPPDLTAQSGRVLVQDPVGYSSGRQTVNRAPEFT